LDLLNSIITFGKNSVGQELLSMQPMLIIYSEFLIISSVISLGFCVLISIPSFFIASIELGFIAEIGLVLAL